jgi:hypothetical protein
MVMLDSKTFHPIPLAESGDRGRVILYSSIGRVTTAWETCDQHFADLYSVFLGHPQSVGVLRAYGALPTFSVRKRLIDAAAESHFYFHPKKALSDEYNRIMKLADNASARRTEIAHGVIFQTSIAPGYFLGPPLHSTKKRGFDYEASYRLNSVQMKGLVKNMRLFRREVYDLTGAILEQLRSLSPKRPGPRGAP